MSADRSELQFFPGGKISPVRTTTCRGRGQVVAGDGGTGRDSGSAGVLDSNVDSEKGSLSGSHSHSDQESLSGSQT
eukprot:CAMPEP_0119132526 /NCGR_PEP_ID=MMETSP1310-20130426/11884_1 /TAXON_ID=464262 /ORGANISM="Genus nov. species nov., Strain RCC2339" /LENGTH=75 /DNA_ID=CAMNT_0007123163 /DNA_START=157 /DNA_END=380 /DNA_ORIENTATION=+